MSTASGQGPAPTSRFVMAALSLPSVVLSAFTLPLAVYLPSYYSGDLGLDLSAVGTAFMVVRLLDIGIDPVLGFLMDKTRTPWGRYRPWMLLGAPLIMIAIAMLFMAEKGVGVGYLVLWLLFGYGGWSVLGLAQLSLSANVTTEYRERSRIFGWWQVAFLVGMIITLLLPKIVALMGLTSPAAGMHAMAWFVIVATPFAVLPAVFMVRERARQGQEHTPNWQAYKALLMQGPVRRVLAIEAVLGLAAGGLSTLFVFFYTRVKGIELENVGVLLLVNSVAGLVFTPFWTWLANRVGKHRSLAISAVVFTLAQAGLYFAPAGTMMGVIPLIVVIGSTYGATSMIPRAMLADVSDMILLETRTDQTGLLYALLTGVWKIGQALAVGLMFMALEQVGFDPAPGAHNPPDALLGLQLLFVGLPALLSLLAVPVIMGYPITAGRHNEIRRALDARAAAESA